MWCEFVPKHAAACHAKYTWQFLVCFQARGAPREGQGDPGARRRLEDPENLLKPIGSL